MTQMDAEVALRMRISCLPSQPPRSPAQARAQAQARPRQAQRWVRQRALVDTATTMHHRLLSMMNWHGLGIWFAYVPYVYMHGVGVVGAVIMAGPGGALLMPSDPPPRPCPCSPAAPHTQRHPAWAAHRGR